MQRDVSAGRLNVLARQLAGVGLGDAAVPLARQDTAAEEARPAPGGGRGTLTVVDNRTGKKYTVSRPWRHTDAAGARPCMRAHGLAARKRHTAVPQTFPQPLGQF